MGDLFHGQRIFIDVEDNKERVIDISFLWDDVLDCRGSKGIGLRYANKTPKTYVTLSQNRGMWLLVPLARFRKQWESYLTGVPEWNYQFTEN
ncbi:MAG: hypothetical protein NVS3B25_21230 [Hymenobacter sp.]